MHLEIGADPSKDRYREIHVYHPLEGPLAVRRKTYEVDTSLSRRAVQTVNKNRRLGDGGVPLLQEAGIMCVRIVENVTS